jgi:hypothetical protein
LVFFVIFGFDWIQVRREATMPPASKPVFIPPIPPNWILEYAVNSPDRFKDLFIQGTLI